MRRKPLGSLAALAVVLAGVRLALPAVVKARLNRSLGSLESFQGHVDRVDISLWRGGIVLRGLSLLSRSEPLRLDVRALDVSVDWRALLHRRVVARVVADHPAATVGAEKPSTGAKAAKKETGEKLPATMTQMMPVDINRFYVRDGRIGLAATADQPEVRLSSVNVEIDNLTNAKGNSPARAHATGNVMDQGTAEVDLAFDPLAEKPTFNLAVTLKKIDLPALNPVLQRQFGVSVKRGTLEMVCEAHAKDGNFDGYVKPFVQDVKAGKGRGPLGAVKQAVLGAAAEILKNPKTQAVAAKAPFHGTFDDPSVGTWAAALSVFRNAFVKALSPSLEGLSKSG